MAAELLAPTLDEETSPTVTVDLPEDSLEAGERVRYLGDYELIEEIARGGMGVVYRARQVSLNRPVAVKLILGGELATDDFVQRFHTEAEAAAALDHPNIVPIHEIGSDGGRHYFSMKLIEGPALSHWLKGAPRSCREVAALMAPVARAIHYAHQRGVLHRDIKPGNILVDADGRPWLTDFGLAKLADRDSAITRTHALMGTPAYMSPEQARGRAKALTTAADIYSFGAVLYECLTGKPPFQGETPIETLRLVLEEDPRRPTTLRPNLDPDLETICLRCLEKDPTRRYGSAEAVGEELDRWYRGEPIKARPATTIERVSKWIRRHPVVALFSAILLLTVSIGAGGITYQWLQTMRARAATEAEAYRAGIALAQSLLERGDRDGARSSLSSLPVRLRHWEWGWLMQQCHQELLTLRPWTKLTNFSGEPLFHRVAFSPDNQMIATWNHREAKIYTALKGELLRTISLDDLTYTVSKDELLRKTSLNDRIRLVPGTTNRIDYWGRPQGLRTVAFTADSRRLILRYRWDATVWDLESGRCALDPDYPVIITDGLQTDATGREYIFLGGDNANVPMRARVDDFSTTWVLPVQMRHEFQEPSTKPLVTRDGRRLIGRPIFQKASDRFGDSPVVLNVWSLEGRTSGEDAIEASIVWPDATLPDFWVVDELAERLVTIDHDGAMRMRRLPENEELWSRQWPQNPDDTPSVTFAEAINRGPGAQWVLVHRQNSAAPPTLEVLDYSTGDSVTRLSERIYRWEVSPDGQTIVTSGADRVAHVWRIRDGKLLRTLRGHTDPILDVRFSPDGRQVATIDGEGALKLWSALPGRERYELEPQNFFNRGSFSPDGTRLATPHFDRSIRIWDVASGQEVMSMLGHLQVVTCVEWSPDGKRLLSGGWDGKVMLWNAETGRRLRVFSGPEMLVETVAFTPQGELAATSADGKVWVWNSESGDLIRQLTMTPGENSSLAYSRDGRSMATVSREEHLKIRRADTYEVIREAPSLMGTAIDWHPDGQTLAVAVPDGRLVIWDTVAGRERGSGVGRGMIRGVRFSVDGERLFASRTEALSGIGRPALEVWHPGSAQLLVSLEGHLTSYNPPAISPDGLKVFSGDDSGAATMWEAFPWRSDPGEDYSLKYWRERITSEFHRLETRREIADQLELWPRREPATPPSCIDLTPHYTASLDVNFLPITQTSSLWVNYRNLPHGLHAFTELPEGFGTNYAMPCRGVPFDLRGMVVLADKARQPPGLDRLFPPKVTGIRVGQKASRLHFLHESTITRYSPLGEVGSYLVHYQDGTTERISLTTRQRQDDWSIPESESENTILGWRVFFSTPLVGVVWGRGRPGPDGEYGPFLHGYTWDNPQPDKEIVSFDFESALSGYHVFLVAVTAETD